MVGWSNSIYQIYNGKWKLPLKFLCSTYRKNFVHTDDIYSLHMVNVFWKNNNILKLLYNLNKGKAIWLLSMQNAAMLLKSLFEKVKIGQVKSRFCSKLRSGTDLAWQHLTWLCIKSRSWTHSQHHDNENHHHPWLFVRNIGISTQRQQASQIMFSRQVTL